jgi:hypothetical protein
VPSGHFEDTSMTEVNQIDRIRNRPLGARWIQEPIDAPVVAPEHPAPVIVPAPAEPCLEIADGQVKGAWLHPLVTVASQGRKVGQIDHSAPLVFEEIEFGRLGDKKYVDSVLARMGHAEDYGQMVVGDKSYKPSLWFMSGGGKLLATGGDFLEIADHKQHFADGRKNGAKRVAPDGASSEDPMDKAWRDAIAGRGSLKACIAGVVEPKTPRPAPKPHRSNAIHKKRGAARVSFIEAQAEKRRREAQREEAQIAKLPKWKTCARAGCEEQHTRSKYCSDRCASAVRSRRYRLNSSSVTVLARN